MSDQKTVLHTLLDANLCVIEGYVNDYEFDAGDDGYHIPSYEERTLIDDAIYGLHADENFVRTFNAWQDAVRAAAAPQPNETAVRPKIVCLCGSTRFFKEFQEASLQETVAGKIVLSIGCNLRSDHQLWADEPEREAIKIRLDELHKRKIDLADEVLVLNIGGYVGESTRSEIDYAIARGKPVRYLENEKL